MPHQVDSARFWDRRYTKGEDGWELGRPAPPLVRLLRDAPPKKGRVAVPGCGRGHDVALFAKLGYDAVGFDFSERAVAAATKLGRRVLRRDVFELGGEFSRKFDVVWEYTCFCAIHPSRRAEYLEVMAKILKKGGELIALFYPLKKGRSGPPFPVNRGELERLLARRFTLTSVEAPKNSVEHRRGLELLVRATSSGSVAAKPTRPRRP